MLHTNRSLTNLLGPKRIFSSLLAAATTTCDVGMSSTREQIGTVRRVRQSSTGELVPYRHETYPGKGAAAFPAKTIRVA